MALRRWAGQPEAEAKVSLDSLDRFGPCASEDTPKGVGMEASERALLVAFLDGATVTLRNWLSSIPALIGVGSSQAVEGLAMRKLCTPIPS